MPDSKPENTVDFESLRLCSLNLEPGIIQLSTLLGLLQEGVVYEEVLTLSAEMRALQARIYELALNRREEILAAYELEMWQVVDVRTGKAVAGPCTRSEAVEAAKHHYACNDNYCTPGDWKKSDKEIELMARTSTAGDDFCIATISRMRLAVPRSA